MAYVVSGSARKESVKEGGTRGNFHLKLSQNMNDMKKKWVKADHFLKNLTHLPFQNVLFHPSSKIVIAPTFRNVRYIDGSKIYS